MNRAVVTSPSQQPKQNVGAPSAWQQSGRPRPFVSPSAGPQLMRPSSIRHSRIPARRPTRRRAAGIAVAIASASVLAISCADEVSVSRLTSADRPASTPAPMVPQNEFAGPAVTVAAPAPTSFRKGARGDGSAAAADEALSASGAAPSAGMPAASAVSAPATTGAMIIRTGTAGIEVDSLDNAIARVRTLALRVNGFIANTTVQGGRDQLRTASLELKIPSERFDDALAGLSPIGKVESVNVNAEDVGEEYVDIAARVENAHRLEARIIDLLANRTGKLQDMLSIEHELARVREEIERYEGRMRFLRTRASVSTLTIVVHEHAPVIVPVAGDGPIIVAFRQAWSSFVGLVASFVASLGVLVPLGVLVFLGWLGVRRHIPWRPAPSAPPVAGEISGD